jgi:hypothetical protein
MRDLRSIIRAAAHSCESEPTVCFSLHTDDVNCHCRVPCSLCMQSATACSCLQKDRREAKCREQQRSPSRSTKPHMRELSQQLHAPGSFQAWNDLLLGYLSCVGIHAARMLAFLQVRARIRRFDPNTSRVTQRPVFDKHRGACLLRTSAFFVAQTLLQTPRYIVGTLLFGCVCLVSMCMCSARACWTCELSWDYLSLASS